MLATSCSCQFKRIREGLGFRGSSNDQVLDLPKIKQPKLPVFSETLIGHLTCCMLESVSHPQRHSGAQLIAQKARKTAFLSRRSRIGVSGVPASSI